jgi:HEAT repeat protein
MKSNKISRIIISYMIMSIFLFNTVAAYAMPHATDTLRQPATALLTNSGTSIANRIVSATVALLLSALIASSVVGCDLERTAKERQIQEVMTDLEKATAYEFSMVDEERLEQRLEFIIEELIRDGVTRLIIDELKEIGGPAIYFIADALLENRHNIRYTRDRSRLVHILGHIGDHRATDILLVIAADKEEPSGVRICAMQSLGRLGNKEAVPHIVEIAGDITKNYDDMNRAIAVTLGKLGDIRGVETLIDILLCDKAPLYVWYNATYALQEIGLEEIAPFLDKALEGKEAEEYAKDRKRIAYVLGMISQDKAGGRGPSNDIPIEIVQERIDTILENLKEKEQEEPQSRIEPESGYIIRTSSSGTALTERDMENIKLAVEPARLSNAKGTVAYNDTILSLNQQQALQSLIGIGTQGLIDLELKLGCRVRLLSQGPVDDNTDTIIISDNKLSDYTKTQYLVINQVNVDLQDKAVYVAIFAHIPIAKGLLGLNSRLEQPELYEALKQSIRNLSQGLLNEREVEKAIEAYINGNPLFIELPPAVSYEGKLENLQRAALMALIAA